MKTGKKLAAVVVSAALTTAFAIPAFAATPGATDTTYDKTLSEGNSFEAPTNIEATVYAPGAKVIKVTVPSQMPISIATQDSNGKHVIDSAKTLPVEATVQNYSQDTAVDVSVAKVTDADNLLDSIALTLTPATTMGTPGGAYALAKGDSIDAPLLTKLAGTTDGATDPGTGTLTLTASADADKDLKSLEGSAHTVTTVLKVAVPASAV